jgi:hypothetical protein
VGGAPASPFGSAPAAVEQRGRDPFGGGSAAPAASAGAGAKPGDTVPCPTCGAAVTPNAPRCTVCGMEFLAAAGGGSSDAGAGAGGNARGGANPFGAPAGGQQAPAQARGNDPFGQAPQRAAAGAGQGGGPFGGGAPPAGPPAAAPQRETRSSAAVCPIHGEMDPTWSRCPQCLKEGRDGRLTTPSSGVPRVAPEPAAPLAGGAPVEPARPKPPSAGFPATQAEPAPAGMPPLAQAPVGPPPQPAAAPPQPPPAVDPSSYRYQTAEDTRAPAEPPRVQQPPPAQQPPPRGGVDRPQSSVGQTFVIRRRPRVLAYLIEKEGEQVGRVFQLEDEVTDIGRDPRNHVVVNDVMVSGFHARVERGPDGNFLVMDRGSSNGSRLNGEPLTVPHPFSENDEVGIGTTTLVLKVVG